MSDVELYVLNNVGEPEVADVSEVLAWLQEQNVGDSLDFFEDRPARRFASLISPETIEKGIKAARSVVLVTDDGREISVAGLLTLDHPELLQRVVEAVLRSVEEGET